jgi:hypothetical protein
MDYKPKSKGTSYIKFLVTQAKKKPNIKHISIPMKQAEDIVKEIDTMNLGQDRWALTSNSLKAGSLVLCIDPKELRERLVHPKPSKLMEQLCEARNKIKSLESIGDKMFETLHYKEQERFANEWVMTKKLFRL